MATKRGCLELLRTLFGSADVVTEAVAEWPYRSKDSLLSPAEISFYHVLASVMSGKAVICPKVGLKDLLFITKRYKSREYYKYFGRISQKHADFVLCEPKSMRPVVVIELDDRSHDQLNRVERDTVVDRIFSAAGLPLLHIKVTRSYNAGELANILEPYLQAQRVQSTEPASIRSDTPVCPRCGVPMVLRIASKGASAGQQFYGCPNYPDCREIVKKD